MNHLEKATNKEKLAGYNSIRTREPERDVSEEAGQMLVQYFWCLSVECSVLVTLCLSVVTPVIISLVGELSYGRGCARASCAWK